MSSAPSPVSNTEGWTVQRILEWTAGFLKQKGVESPRLEAELLLAFARKCPRIRLYTDFTELLSEDQRTVMRELVQRRARREPLAYLVGTKEFYGRSFEVGPGVLIPRPETETLVDVCLDRIPAGAPQHILEVGFGSGCISITIARQRPQCRLTATDISAAAMAVASRNVQKLAVADRVLLTSGDCLEPLLNTQERFDGLVSNPPYIRDDERDSLQPEIAAYEPPEALFAGIDGLDVVRKIIRQASGVLRPGAFLAMELDSSQCSQVAAMLSEGGFSGTRIHPDMAGLDRIVEATFSG